MKMALNVQGTINYYFALNKCQGSRQLHQQQTVLTEKLNYPDIIVKSQWYLCPGKTVFIWQEATWAKLWAAEGSVPGPQCSPGPPGPCLDNSPPPQGQSRCLPARESRAFETIPAQVPRAI